MKSILTPPEFGALVEFGNTDNGQSFFVSVATLLQCLCIAEERLVVPPFEQEWAAVAIPPVLRARSRCLPLEERTK